MTELEKQEAISKVVKQINELDLKIARLQIARDNLNKRYTRLTQKPKPTTAPSKEEREKQSQAARKRQADLMAQKLVKTFNYKPEAAAGLTRLNLEKKPQVQKDEQDPT